MLPYEGTEEWPGPSLHLARHSGRRIKNNKNRRKHWVLDRISLTAPGEFWVPLFP